MSVAENKWPGGYTGQCNPDIWNESAKPAQPAERKIGHLTEQQVNEYFTQVGIGTDLPFLTHSE